MRDINLATVVARHTGADFESGRLHRRNDGPPDMERPLVGTEEEQPTTGLHHQPGRASGGLRARQVPARRSVPERKGPVWATVTVHPEPDNLMKLQPQVDCNTCGKKNFMVNASRIVAHITGSGGISACTPANPTPEWLELKASLLKEMSEKASSKSVKRAASEVDAAVEAGTTLSPPVAQRPLESALNIATAQMCDEAIADFFYGDNIPDRIAESSRFKRLCKV